MDEKGEGRGVLGWSPLAVSITSQTTGSGSVISSGTTIVLDSRPYWYGAVGKERLFQVAWRRPGNEGAFHLGNYKLVSLWWS